MGTAKWDGAVAVALASSATDEPGVTNAVYPIAESAQIEMEPITYERRTILADLDYIIAAGFNYTWAINNIRPNANVFGYLMMLALGTDTWSSTKHILTPSDDGLYCNVFIDRGLDLVGTSKPTQVLVGAKVTGFTLEFPLKDNAILGLSGVGCDLGTELAALSPSVPTGDDEAPLSWKALQNGHFKVGLNAGSTAQDDSIQGFKLEGSRASMPSGVSLGSDQPSAIHLGVREFFFEFTKEFATTTEKDQYIAHAAQQDIGVEFDAQMGSTPYYATMYEMRGKPVQTFAGEVGVADEIIMATMRCKARKYSSDPIIKFDVVDGTSAAYQ